MQRLFIVILCILLSYCQTSRPDNDAAEPWGLFFQDNALAQIEALE